MIKRYPVKWNPETGEATKEIQAVKRLWTRFPDAFVGIPTGQRSGLYVIDEDESGAAQRLGLEFPENTYMAKTVRGMHYFLAPPVDGLPVKNSADDKVDVRGDGGMIVMYQEPPVFASLPALKGSLLVWARSRNANAQGGSESGYRIPDKIANGALNTTLTSMIGTMNKRGFSERAILAAIRVENEDRAEVPATDDTLVRLVHDQINRYPNVPQALSEYVRTFQMRNNGNARA